MIKFLSCALFFLILVDSQCSANGYIIPTKYEDQEEIFIQGIPVTLSKKTHSIIFYQTCKTLVRNKANFFFSFSNQATKPVNLLFSNLKVMDQLGRPIKVLHKNVLIANKQGEKDWKELALGVSAGFASLNAQNTGSMDYRSLTLNNDMARTRDCYEKWEYGLNHYYFDSTTVFPEKTYSANIQIDVPQAIKKDLQHIIFTFDVGDEVHSFCFYYSNGIKNLAGKKQ